MSNERGHTTDFLFDSGEFFVAHLDNGGIRVGMNWLASMDIPAGHSLYAEAAALSLDRVESFIDTQIEAGRFPLAA